MAKDKKTPVDQADRVEAPGLPSANDLDVVANEEQIAKATTQVTEHHVEFLKSRGYSISTVEEARNFIGDLLLPERDGFFAEAEQWKPSPTAQKTVVLEVLSPIRHDSGEFAIGDSIELFPDDAEILVLCGAAKRKQ